MCFRGIVVALCFLVPLSAFAEDLGDWGTIAANEFEDDQSVGAETSPEEELLFTEQERVTIATKRAVPVGEAPANVVVISHDEIIRSPTLSLPEIIRRVAGVDVIWITAADTEVSIRGFADPLTQGDNIAVLIDGRVVNMAPMGGTFWSALPVSRYDIKHIEIIKGPMSSLHGDRAFLGIVNIVTFDPENTKTTLAGGGGMYWAARGDFVHAGTFGGDVWYKITGTYKRDDEVDDLGNDGRSKDLGMFGTTAMFEYCPVEKKTRARLTGGVSQGYYAMHVGGISHFDMTDGFVMGDAAHDFGKGGTLSFKSWWRRIHASSRDLFTVGSGGAYNVDNVSAEINHAVTFDVTDWFANSSVFGFEYRLLSAGAFNSQDINNFAGFLQTEMRFWDKFIVTAGFRLDYQKDFTGLNKSAHGSIVWIAHPRYTLRVSGSLAYNTPTFYNLFLDLPNINIGPFSARAFGNRNLASEEIVYAELGNIVKPLDWLTLNLDFFYYRMKDLITPSLTATSPTTFDATFINRGGAQAVGGEAGIEAKPIKNLTVYANWAYEYFKAVGGNLDTTPNLGNPLNKVNTGLRYASDFGLFINLDFYWIQAYWRKAGVAMNFDVTPATRLGNVFFLNARLGYQPIKNHLEIAVIANNILDDNTPFIPATDSLLGTRTAERPGFRLLGTLSYTF